MPFLSSSIRFEKVAEEEGRKTIQNETNSRISKRPKPTTIKSAGRENIWSTCFIVLQIEYNCSVGSWKTKRHFDLNSETNKEKTIRELLLVLFRFPHFVEWYLNFQVRIHLRKKKRRSKIKRHTTNRESQHWKFTSSRPIDWMND